MSRRSGDYGAEPRDSEIDARPRDSRGRVRWTEGDTGSNSPDIVPPHGKLIREFLHTPLWSYRPETSPETLLRHWHRARRALLVAFCSCALVCTSTLELMLSEPGWWRTLWFVLLIASTGVALLTLLPMTVIWAWAGEIEKECGRRGIALPDSGSLEPLAQHAAMKAVFYVAALVLVVNVFGRNSEWRPLACAFALAITIWTLISMFKRPARTT